MKKFHKRKENIINYWPINQNAEDGEWVKRKDMVGVRPQGEASLFLFINSLQQLKVNMH